MEMHQIPWPTIPFGMMSAEYVCPCARKGAVRDWDGLYWSGQAMTGLPMQFVLSENSATWIVQLSTVDRQLFFQDHKTNLICRRLQRVSRCAQRRKIAINIVGTEPYSPSLARNDYFFATYTSSICTKRARVNYRQLLTISAVFLQFSGGSPIHDHSFGSHA